MEKKSGKNSRKMTTVVFPEEQNYEGISLPIPYSSTVLFLNN